MTQIPHPNNPTALMAVLEEAVGLLASAHMIASRRGSATNWPAFQESLRKCLAEFNHNGVTARTYRLPPYNETQGPSQN